GADATLGLLLTRLTVVLVVATAASQQGGVAERSRKYRGASADREAGVVFRSEHTMKTTPSAPAKEASRRLIMAQPPLLAVMQGEFCTPAIRSQLRRTPCRSLKPALRQRGLSQPQMRREY